MESLKCYCCTHLNLAVQEQKHEPRYLGKYRHPSLNFLIHFMKTLREQKRHCRRQLSAQIQQQHAQKVFKQLKNQSFFKQNQKMALYLASDGELDPIYIAQFATLNHQNVYLPVLHPFKKNQLWFCEWTDQPLIKNKFNIAEPDYQQSPPLDLATLDLIFVPLTVFNIKGHRLGMGGGYYDRTLANIKNEKIRPLLIGLAHDCQKATDLNIQAWDIAMDHIITEQHIYPNN